MRGCSTFRVFLIALAFAKPPAAAVRVGVVPDPPFVERDEKGLYLNCDFRVENQTGEKIRLTRIEVSTFDAANRISSRRFLSEQGSLSSALLTLPRREIESDAVVDIFNPFHTLDPVAPADTVRFEFQFQGNRQYDAVVTTRPVLYRPKTKLVAPLRGRFLVYDGHDYYSHHRRIDLSSPAIRRIGMTFNPVRYAYDFSPVDESRSWHRGDPGKPENWIAYDAPLYAPAAGRVVSAANDVPDNRIESGRLVYPESPNEVVKRLFGNYVLIDHGAGEYSLLAHLKMKTVAVGLNDRVSRDQFVGRIGFSGDTGLHVHVHYQLTDRPNPLEGSSLPVYFSEYRLPASGRRFVREGLMHTGEFIER
ncbi:MAG: M23 family metallopeptidase [Acidobacteria bacterium]|nr:M23 family metallopeptidase [Acidobacteriota bacterium]